MSERVKHQDNMSVRFIPPCSPLLYSKTGVYRGIHYFLIFAPKHSLTEAALTCTHNLCFGQKSENIKKKKKMTENCHFYIRKNCCIQCIAWACFRNV